MSEFRAKDIGLKAQKKLASKLSNKTVVKMLVDDSTSQLLDNLCTLCHQVSGDKKASEKVTKNLIKVIVKVGLLNKHDQFSAEERVLAAKFQRKFQLTALAVISFHEIDFSYDQAFILSSLTEMRQMLLKLVESHLTDKSSDRVNNIFDFFGKEDFVDAVFCGDSKHRDLLGKITKDLHSLLEMFDDDTG